MKVYCENCKWYSNKSCIYIIDFPDIFIQKKPNNVNHNCKYYIRKWWKFWI
jgi:hypothetical protein